MNNLVKLICVLSALTIAACTTKSKESDAAALYAESMKIHDQVMPHRDELLTLRQKLTLRLDSLKSDSVANGTLIREMRNGVENLEKADREMMDWMHNVKDVPGAEHASVHNQGDHEMPAEAASSQDILQVQQEQKEAIEKVRKDMEESMETAKQLLAK